MNRSLLIVAGLGLALSGPVLAQAQPENKQPPAAPLGGPSVAPRDVPGVEGQFGDSPEAAKRRFADRIPPRVMKQALGAVLGEDAADDVRATPEQREKLDAIQRDYEQQVRDYIQQHRKELEELREQLPGGGPAAEMLRRLDGPGGKDAPARRRSARPADDGQPKPPDAMNDPMTDRPAPRPPSETEQRERFQQMSPEVKERLRELMEGMPQPEQAFTKAWQELNPKQREAVEARLDEFRERQAQMREDAYVKQRTGKKQGDRPDGKAPGEVKRPNAGGKPGEPNAEPKAPFARGPKDAANAERRERLMRMFERMTPEQQDQLLERLEARLREAGGAGPKRPERGQPKPPPPMDEQPVPNPDEVNRPAAPAPR